MIKIILKCFLIVVLFIVAVNLLEPVIQPELTDEQKVEIGKREYMSEVNGSERIRCIDDNEEAFLWRLRMIESARESIVFATFDFREDNSGTDVMAALYSAAERGVKVQILLDGLNYMLYLDNSDLFRALCAHDKVEVRVCNPVGVKNIFYQNYRMHDKYLIVDNDMYLLGGRNTNDIFLGDHTDGINIDREILVYESKPGEGESLLACRQYFSDIWKESSVEEQKPSVKEEKLAEAYEILRNRNVSACQKNEEIKNYNNWLEDTIPANKITFLHNGIRARKKDPVMLYELEHIMEQGKDVIIQTPYVICNDKMYEVLANVREHADVRIILNAVERGSNPWGCTDYLNNKEKIENTGVTVYELLNEYAVHTKTILVDNRISIVGSYNWDARSTYLDTELMLVIDSEPLNQHIREMSAAYMAKSKEVRPDGTETEGKDYQGFTLPTSKKLFYNILRIIIIPFRHLL